LKCQIESLKTGYYIDDLPAVFVPVPRKYFVLIEIIDILTQACKVCIHDEDVAETDFEHTYQTPKGSRSGFGKYSAPPAVGHLEKSKETTSNPYKRPSFPDHALPFLEKLAGTIDRRQTRNCHWMASKGLQAVLEI
jgi:hypothetical protein